MARQTLDVLTESDRPVVIPSGSCADMVMHQYAVLLANSGGFLLAPLFVVVLRLSLKESFATSLAVAAVMAVPGTLVHAALGHIDWAVVGIFAVTSIPLSFLGARVAIRSHPVVLERVYGVGLAILGATLLLATA